MKKLLSIIASIACLHPTSNLLAGASNSKDDYNVVWTSPSKDYNGSMPIGNGELAANVWVEPNGDLIFYLSKSDTWTGGNPSHGPELVKLGRVRVRLDKPLYQEGADFRQKLDLKTGSITVHSSASGQKRDVRFWIDANRPVVHVDIQSSVAYTVEIALESWRAEGKWLQGGAQNDVILPSDGQTVRWYQRNVHSVFSDSMTNQHLGHLVGKFHDPLMSRTFGGQIVGEGLKAKDSKTLVTAAPSRSIHLSIHALTAQTETPEDWLAQLERQRGLAEAVTIEAAWSAHAKWWQAFWQRSWIHVTSAGGVAKTAVPTMIPSNALNFRFGITPSNGEKFQGKLGRASILKRALTEAEIKKIAGSQSADTGLNKEDILFSSTPALYSELKDSAAWTDSTEMTFEAWINPTAGAPPGRIIDKTMPGNDEGFLLDTYPGDGLRLIAGKNRFDVRSCLKAGVWNHVAVAVDAGQQRMEIYLNGERIAGQGSKKIKSDLNEPFEVSQAYALQRFVTACAGRGNYPIKFNGSLFTVDGIDNYQNVPAGQYCGPDHRRWGGPYWFQNTRLIYWPMLSAGDYDEMKPLFNMYRDMLPLLKERTRHYFGHDGVFFSETTQIWGLNRNEDFGRGNPAFYPTSGYMKYYWDGGLELSTMLLAYYLNTGDESFVRDTLLPIADEAVLFYDQHYQRTKEGRLHISPSQSLETWHTAEDPLPVVAGLRTVLTGLLALPKPLTTAQQRARWQRLLGELKELPIAEEAGKKWLKPAHVFSDRKNSENPELYAVFPYPVYGVGKPDLEIGRETFSRRGNKRTGGWQQDAIQAALLGLTDQAKAYLLQNVTTENLMGGAIEKANRPDSRFPAFWGPNFDWIPDQCNGSVILSTLQCMLMQTDGKKINLLPAWPKDWNTDFKLHAPYQTTVEGRVENGALVELEVTPESRRKDVIVSELFSNNVQAHVAVPAERAGAILKPAALRRYVATFNSQRPDDTAEGLPGDGSVTAISNAQAADWMEQNVPLFECSDKDIEETYYFRWWTYRKHIWQTPDGFVVTEFLPKVSWSKKYNTINCPVGHQLYEGRWLRDPKTINDYTQFHFGKGGDPGGSSKMYSQWITDAIYARYLVNADKPFVTGLLDALVKNHEAWKQGNPAGSPWQKSRLLENGLYWQVDSWEGQEFSIGGTGIRPSINSYMFGEDVAIARIAELAGRNELADQYRAEAEQLRKRVQSQLWDSDAKFFKVMRHTNAPMNQYSNSVAEVCEPGKLIKARESFGFVPWYFNLPEAGCGYEEAWRQLTDPQGFLGQYGPTVAERRHPNFFINAAGCMWCGASWPFSTAQTLTALANVLNNYRQGVVGKKEYFDTLEAYTQSHRLTLDGGRVVSWLDESLNPDTGRWMKVGPFPKTRGRDYNHSTYCDLVITGLVGLRPRADDLVEVNPLVPEGVLDYFCLDNVRYHGRNLTILWDKTGKRYGRGAGLRVLADRREIAHSETLAHVTGDLPNR